MLGLPKSIYIDIYLLCIAFLKKVGNEFFEDTIMQEFLNNDRGSALWHLINWYQLWRSHLSCLLPDVLDRVSSNVLSTWNKCIQKKRSVPLLNGIDRLLFWDIELLTNGWLWLLSRLLRWAGSCWSRAGCAGCTWWAFARRTGSAGTGAGRAGFRTRIRCWGFRFGMRTGTSWAAGAGW